MSERLKITRIGNSAGIILPKAVLVLDAGDLSEGELAGWFRQHLKNS